MTSLHSLWWGGLGLGASDYLQLFAHFVLLSLLAVGGAITTVPEMHRYVVDDRRWLDDAQFSGCVALAQASPGPNMLFVAVIGFNVGGLMGVLATMVGCLLPSTVLGLTASRGGERHRDSRAVRAFTLGLAPVSVGLLVATAWILIEPTRGRWSTWLLLLATVLWMTRTRRSPLWPIAAGAAAGLFGWV